MKKKILMTMALTAIMALTGCSSGSGNDNESNESKGSDTLVLYSPNSEGLVNAIIPAFEEKTGITVELQQAGTGELFTKLQGEKADPVADVIWGGSYNTYLENKDLFEEYVSPNDEKLPKAYQNTEGFKTSYTLDGSVLIVNKDLTKGMDIKSYDDLLNPKLKGKIATADPASSSSAFAHLTNMLKAKGGYDSDEAWEYVKKLFTNIDGKIQSSSSSVYKTVVDGEMAVGLSYEDPVMQLVKDGADNIEIVYMDEGVVYLPAGSAIIKNAKNMENAKKFIDFIIDKQAQDTLGKETTNRPVREDAEVSDFMTPIDKINVIEEDYDYVREHSSEITDRYKEIFTSIQGN
ncbi:MAG: ABC transporter substrate-binding protein [Tissierellia bacterium]|nr:ABC transporter substrate-binding protein [Tissierellia bacterium]